MSGASRFVLPYQTVIDATGEPIPGAQLFFYASGTTTPQATYSNAGLTTPNANPVISNANGQFPAIFLGAAAYKVVLEDENNVQLWTADPVQAVSSFNTTVTATAPNLVGFVAHNTTSNASWALYSDANSNGVISYTNSNITAQYWDTSGNAYFSNNIAVPGTLTVGGAAALGGSLTVTGASAFNGGVTITGGGVNVTGPVSATGSVNATGGVNAGANSGVTGSFATTGSITCGGNMTVSGAFSASGASGFSGNLTVGNNLFVPGGTVSIFGSCTAQVYYTTSDQRTKTSIAPITATEAWNWIGAGKPVTYTDQGGRSNVAGFIAQADLANVRSSAVEQVPDSTMIAVGSSPAGQRYVRDYTQDIAYLTAALQDVQNRLKALNA